MLFANSVKANGSVNQRQEVMYSRNELIVAQQAGYLAVLGIAQIIVKTVLGLNS